MIFNQFRDSPAQSYDDCCEDKYAINVIETSMDFSKLTIKNQRRLLKYQYFEIESDNWKKIKVWLIFISITLLSSIN